MKVKALPLYVYKSRIGSCSNGGWTERNDELYVECPEGYLEVENDHPGLFVLERGMYLRPKTERKGVVGPMMGGCYAATSDSRFSKLCARVGGGHFYGAVPVHDRYETQYEYDILSR